MGVKRWGGSTASAASHKDSLRRLYIFVMAARSGTDLAKLEVNPGVTSEADVLRNRGDGER